MKIPSHWIIDPPRIQHEYLDGSLVQRLEPGGSKGYCGHGYFDLHLVTAGSKKPVMKAAAKLSRFFQRELGCDFAPYSDCESIRRSDGIFIVTTTDHTTEPVMDIGVGLFVFRYDAELAGRYCFCAAWLHPFLRRCGLLDSCWELFRRKFGDFLCENPVSPAMKAFLAKRGECTWCGRTTRWDCPMCNAPRQLA